MATKTRAELIALLKSRGIKGRLSKMTKAQLLAKVNLRAAEKQERDAEGAWGLAINLGFGFVPSAQAPCHTK